MSLYTLPRRISLLVLAAVAWSWISNAQAHDFSVGGLRIDHPYATPSVPGSANGAVYLRSIRNGGGVSDRLVSASTTVAERVERSR